MFFKSIIKTPKHRVFNYTPRFYDEKKELMEKRLRENDAENGGAYVSNIERGSFAKNRNKSELQGDFRKSNLRLIIILALLAGLTYIILK